ncbi:MAG: hypothetical protein H6746_19630 [Deltaproteobacteria bacterium]|nr:hypothetical protein [Deltaproteobacteria bacterium]
MPASRWILGSPARDLSAILLPGLAGLALASLLAADSRALVLGALVAAVVVDSGHVYLTAWRTVLRPAERRASRIYWGVPLAVVAAITLWLLLALPGLWTALVYLTVFHHVRQFYGVSRWYQKLAGRFDAPSGRWLYALTITPFLIFHVRPGVRISLFSGDDLLLHPHPGAWLLGLGLFAVLALAWLSREALLWRRGVREPGRVLSIAAPATLYALCFLVARTEATILVPLLLSHGIPYFALMGLSLRRLEPARYRTALGTVALLLLTAVVLGGAESWTEQNIITTETPNYARTGVSLAQALLTGLLLVPLLSHYIWDAFIWRGDHRDARTIYTSPRPADTTP